MQLKILILSGVLRRRIENGGDMGTQASKMKIQPVPAQFCHTDFDVTLNECFVEPFA